MVTPVIMMVMAPVVVVIIVRMRMRMSVIVMMVSGIGRPFPLIHLTTFMATHEKAPPRDAIPVPTFEAA